MRTTTTLSLELEKLSQGSDLGRGRGSTTVPPRLALRLTSWTSKQDGGASARDTGRWEGFPALCLPEWTEGTLAGAADPRESVSPPRPHLL